MFNVVLLCLELDSRAEYPGVQTAGEAPRWLVASLDACFLFFATELVLRLFVEGRRFGKNMWNRVDSFIIGAGLLEYVLKWTGMDLTGAGMFRITRLCRLLR